MAGLFDPNYDLSSISKYGFMSALPDAPEILPVPIPNAPTMPAINPAFTGGGGLFAGMSGMDKVNTVLGGLQTIGNLWGAFQQAKLAKKQYRLSRDTAQANLTNQIKSYNTALEDRARSRGMVEGQSAAQTQAYVDQNKLQNVTLGAKKKKGV